VKKRQGLE
jgi:hypothetical protein